MVVFRFWKTFSQSSFQENFADFLSSWIIGWICLASFGRNLDMAVRRPIRRWTSLTLLGLRILMTALHFSGLASMSRCVSMKPRNLPRSTPNKHFSGLSLRLYCRSAENMVVKRSNYTKYALFDIAVVRRSNYHYLTLATSVLPS